MQDAKAPMCRKNYFPSARYGIVALLLAASLPNVQALAPTTVFLLDSIRQVKAASSTGTVNPHRAFISRQELTSAETSAPMEFEVALKMRNFSELQARVSRGGRISLQEMQARYDPLPSDAKAAADWLTSHGFIITRQDGNHHLAVFARGTISQIQQAMRVRFARVALEGAEYTSAVTAPSLPASLSAAVLGVNGLQPHIRPHTHLIAKPSSLTGTNPPFLPSQIAKADNATGLYSSNITGAGQTIAIVIDTFPLKSDLTSFWTTYGVNQSIANISFIQVVSGTLPATSQEETLDTEWASSIAPGAKVRVYATLSLGYVDQAYEQILTDVTIHPELEIHQMSLSYGEGESYATKSMVDTDDQYFAALAGAGVTVFASSGDQGSTPGQDLQTGAVNENGPLGVESPASDPNVTGVGGTSLMLNTDGSVKSETVWNNFSGAPGGGTSIYFTRPSWQTGTGMPSGTMRTVPDVAAPADPNTGAVLIFNGGQTFVGGTSWGSPTWAGYCALINQARANANLSSLGVLGPQIYPLIGTANFRDIVSGNNATLTSGGLYTAGVGYDEASGIGVPLVQTLSQTLTQTPTPPQAQIQPPFQDLVPGQNAAITVSATGSPVGYQWRRMPIGTTTWNNLSDTGTYSGSATASLTISGATLAMSGDQFQCVLTYAGPTSVTSPSSSLVVDTPFTISNVAGTIGTQGNVNGTGSAAQFAYPSGIAIDSSGNLFVADFFNNSIREVTPAGVVSTPYGSTAGNSDSSGSTDGTGNNARFNGPNALVTDISNNLYVADTGNNSIRKITASTGAVSTLATGFNGPDGIAIDSFGNLYVADTGNNVIKKLTSNGDGTFNLSTLAGNSGTAGYVNDTGTAAEFNGPNSVAVDSQGNVYVADLNNVVIRKITQAGVVTLFAGQPNLPGYVDGVVGKAAFNGPTGVAVDGSDNVYVTDSIVPPIGSIASGNNLLRRISTAGVVSTIAGQPGVTGSGSGTGTAAQFYSLQSATFNSVGEIFLADTYNQTVRVGTPSPLPAISATATQAEALVFGPTPGQFTLTRTGDTSASLTVNYFTSGTAISGTDYTALSGTLTIPSGQSFAMIAVNPISDSQATSSPTVQLTLSAAGTYTAGFPSTATVTIQEITPYQSWKLSEFGANATVADIAGDTADPNHNGVPNLLEYAFNSDPLQTGTEPLPTVFLMEDGGLEYLAITYTQLNTDPSLTFTVQVTGDLTQQIDQWHSGPSYTTIVSQVANGSTTQVTVRDNTAISQATKRFIRVQVAGP
jgi:kumamolisin